MCIPRIFQWPTPWLWGALFVMIATSSDRFDEFVALTCMVVIVASIIHHKRRGRDEVDEVRRTGADSDLHRRLAEIERRITDTQDVMIALSEKMDRWEEERAKPQVESNAHGSE